MRSGVPMVNEDHRGDSWCPATRTTMTLCLLMSLKENCWKPWTNCLSKQTTGKELSERFTTACWCQVFVGPLNKETKNMNENEKIVYLPSLRE